MFFSARVFHTSKDAGFPEEYEDAFCVDPELGTAAIADGVSNAIFSGTWAQILTAALVENPPHVHDAEAFAGWLTERRAAWLAGIDFAKLGYFQKAKLREVGGAFCTLCWVQVYQDIESNGSTAAWRYRAYALGDSCLFHIRDGQLLRSFPLQASAEFDLDPASICSVNLGRDGVLDFKAIDEPCAWGDLLILCTDAVAKELLGRTEIGETVDWQRYAELAEDEWFSEIEAAREDRRIRRDDCTLIWLRMGEPAPQAALPSVQTDIPSSLEESPDAACVSEESNISDECGTAAVSETAVDVAGDEQAAEPLPSAVPCASMVEEADRESSRDDDQQDGSGQIGA